MNTYRIKDHADTVNHAPTVQTRAESRAETAHMSPAEHAEWRRQEVQRKERQHEAKELGMLKSAYHRRYMKTPGATEAAFEREWPSLLDDHRRAVARGEDPLDKGEPANPHADPKKWGL